ncbi:carbamoyltransferase [Mycolicibacterium smegmatis]|uniref:carbamoyltransferase family protein n=1 Tax=Mycolicibacterium smegmatis TaxID=1772 RepID=UPI0005D86A90|nr:carbamoyltransferase C-terminal domain-containing protein [Mycolicibacterium smegmatis]MDF1902930.1 carbamoyltransferase C-terminal domain-containing protein [Mycolicibacterium smegmatis]MDF1909205.1 carbamoyltransferase C-terminal domain-containing protein [Mycolicibacterium smegmatis]MDF1921384.1 carbamoyltransferase C-terminal domain-containing protein [Mycolicibacterium smegmatis]MDF1927728.1 carbamoyltransferase C-terminal domain-containing protein [Mycolicibacterium smegmatis]UAK53944
MRILGINAVFHDPAAALVVDGHIVAAAEEERFSRRKHGKEAVAFSTWELPVQAARWCLEQAGLSPSDLDAVGYSYDPRLMQGQGTDLAGLDRDWEYLRTLYAERAPRFLQSALPGLDPDVVRYVRHHVAHAASSALASPHPDCAVLVVDGRGERTSMLMGDYTDNKLDILATQDLPHSLGLLYEDLTQHLGFKRSSDEYKVMAMASYGRPRFVDEFRELVRATGDGGFRTEPVDWDRYGTEWDDRVDLACSVQCVVEEVLLDLVQWLRARTDHENLCLAGGVALNCVANSKLYNSGGFRSVWVQPAAGDSGTALGAALSLAAEAGEPITPMPTAALGRGFSDDEIEAVLTEAAVPFERPRDFAAAVGDALAEDRIVGWFQGRSEFGPRALGRRSLLADPRRAENLDRLNAVKGREQFRPVAPMVLAECAAEIFSGGPLPSPYMLFVHDVAPQWRAQIPAVTHVDNTARIQTVDNDDALLHATISRFAERTGVPVIVNTSFNTAGRPMVDTPRDALECFGSAPIDVLAIGPFLVRRPR